jgi:CHAD domain-containing protein
MPQLEFCLPPEDLPRLLRLPPFARRGGRAARFECIWHDTAGGELSAAGFSLCESGSVWRLEQAYPGAADAWPPGTPTPLLAEAAEPAGLGDAVASLGSPLMPMAAFHGRRRVIRLEGAEPASLTVTEGVARSVADERAVCRLVLDGPAQRLMALSTDLAAAALPIAVPLCSLASEATALARGTPPKPRRSGSARVPAQATVTDAVALVIGHLTDVMLAAVPAVCAGDSPQPVHAMRVALRRLRSALSVFRRAADCPAFAAVKPQLHALAGVLGTARDWDVFLMGTGQDVAEALAGDRRIETMLTAAHRQRDAAYAALRQLFASPEFRQLAVALVQLAALRPWEWEADEERSALLQADAARYAAGRLAKRHEHMLSPGADISGLPAEELHALRKQSKRLRYAAEFFAPLHSRRDSRRFVRRVCALQEALGHLNDGAAAAGLMQSLRGGPDRQFAAGAVQGFTAARSLDARSAIARSWSKFRRATPFWE